MTVYNSYVNKQTVTNGIALFQTPSIEKGVYLATARYVANKQYVDSTCYSVIVDGIPSVQCIPLVESTEKMSGDSLKAQALYLVNGEPLRNEPVVFNMNGAHLGSVLTDSNGIATCPEISVIGEGTQYLYCYVKSEKYYSGVTIIPISVQKYTSTIVVTDKHEEEYHTGINSYIYKQGSKVHVEGYITPQDVSNTHLLTELPISYGINGIEQTATLTYDASKRYYPFDCIMDAPPLVGNYLFTLKTRGTDYIQPTETSFKIHVQSDISLNVPSEIYIKTPLQKISGEVNDVFGNMYYPQGNNVYATLTYSVDGEKQQIRREVTVKGNATFEYPYILPPDSDSTQSIMWELSDEIGDGTNFKEVTASTLVHVITSPHIHVDTYDEKGYLQVKKGTSSSYKITVTAPNNSSVTDWTGTKCEYSVYNYTENTDNLDNAWNQGNGVLDANGTYTLDLSDVATNPSGKYILKIYVSNDSIETLKPQTWLGILIISGKVGISELSYTLGSINTENNTYPLNIHALCTENGGNLVSELYDYEVGLIREDSSKYIITTDGFVRHDNANEGMDTQTVLRLDEFGLDTKLYFKINDYMNLNTEAEYYEGDYKEINVNLPQNVNIVHTGIDDNIETTDNLKYIPDTKVHKVTYKLRTIYDNSPVTEGNVLFNTVYLGSSGLIETKMDLTVSSTNIELGTNITISAKLYEARTNDPIEGEEIIFRAGTIELGRQTTNSSGSCNMSYTVSQAISNINVAYMGSNKYKTYSKGVDVTVYDQVVLTAVAEDSVYNSTISITGNRSPTASGIISVYIDDSYASSVTLSGSSNTWSCSVPCSYAKGNHTLVAYYAGKDDTATYGGVHQSEVTTFTVTSQPSLTLTGTKSSCIYTETQHIQGVLKDALGNTMASQTIHIFIDSSEVGTATTDSSGVYSYDLTTTSSGSHTIQTTFNETTYYNSCSASTTYTAYNNTSSMGYWSNPTLKIGTESTIGCTLYNARKSDFNTTLGRISGATVKVYVNGTYYTSCTSQSMGQCEIQYTPKSSGSYTFKFVFEGDNIYQSCNASKSFTVNPTYTASFEEDEWLIVAKNGVTDVTLDSKGLHSGLQNFIYWKKAPIETINADVNWTIHATVNITATSGHQIGIGFYSGGDVTSDSSYKVQWTFQRDSGGSVILRGATTETLARYPFEIGKDANITIQKIGTQIGLYLEDNYIGSVSPSTNTSTKYFFFRNWSTTGDIILKKLTWEENPS